MALKEINDLTEKTTLVYTDEVLMQETSGGTTKKVQVGTLSSGITANAQTGTTYTLVIGDAGKLVTLSNASAITLTIPANASVAFAVGTVIDLLQLGAGQVTVAITSDTLSSSSGNVKLTGQYSAASIVKTAATTWVLFGDIAA